MRLTLALQMPQLRKRMKDASWQRWRKRAIPDLGTEAKLREAGISVEDANQFVQQEDKNIYPPNWKLLPDAKPVFPQIPKNDVTHPDWHDVPKLVFDQKSFPIEGVKQAQVFTKSIQIKQGLPDSVLERSNFTKLENQDHLVQRVIMQAFLWDAYLEKMPNLRNHDFPTYRFRRPFGIPAKRSNEILVRNFIRLIESSMPEIASTRILSSEEEFRLNLTRHGAPVQFKLSPMTNILSKQLLSSNLDQQKLIEFEDQEIPKIYPFLSTTNIEDSNIYKDDDYFAVSEKSVFPYIHTSIFSHHIPGSHTHLHPRWNNDRFTGSTIMYGFASALLMARRKFGNDVKDLPEPVTTQVVHVTGKEFQFSVFQLNTLDLEENSKVKNIVWVTDKMTLFDKVENQLGKEVFEGYNPEVFKTLLGMYSS